MGNFNCSKNSPSRPYLPPYLKLLSNSKWASFYNILNKQYNNVTLKTKWDTILNINLAEKDWTNIYKVCFRSLKRNDFIWFQFRVIQRILRTRAYLHKVKLGDSPTRTFCQKSNETIFHLFATCPKSFWILVKFLSYLIVVTKIRLWI